MAKATLIWLMCLFLLFLGGLLAGRQVFSPAERALDKDLNFSGPWTPEKELAYKKVRLAFCAFDLAAGLTRQEMASLPEARPFSLYYLLACLWLVLGLRWLRQRGNPAKARPPGNRTGFLTPP